MSHFLSNYLDFTVTFNDQFAPIVSYTTPISYSLSFRALHPMVIFSSSKNAVCSGRSGPSSLCPHDGAVLCLALKFSFLRTQQLVLHRCDPQRFHVTDRMASGGWNVTLFLKQFFKLWK